MDDIIASFKMNCPCRAASEFELGPARIKVYAFARKDWSKSYGNVVNPSGRGIQDIDPDFSVRTGLLRISRKIEANLSPRNSLLLIRIENFRSLDHCFE